MKKETDICIKKKRKLSYSDFELTSLALPGIIFFAVFCYLPMFGVIIAFKRYNYNLGIIGSKWIGFKNFEFFFKSQDAFRITRNTICYNAAFIIIGITCAVIVALLLNEVRERGFVKFFQTSMILPNFMSWVIVGYISYIFLSPNLGVINNCLEMFGIERIQWYSDTVYWPYILVFFNVWKHVGMDSVMYYASLMGIDKSLYEAATVDGASELQKVWIISIPHLIPVITILAITKVGSIFRGDFGLFYQIPRDLGTLYPVTDVIDTYVYRGLQAGDLGASSAVGLFQSVVGFVMIILTNSIVKKIEPDNAMF